MLKSNNNSESMRMYDNAHTHALVYMTIRTHGETHQYRHISYTNEYFQIYMFIVHSNINSRSSRIIFSSVATVVRIHLARNEFQEHFHLHFEHTIKMVRIICNYIFLYCRVKGEGSKRLLYVIHIC